VPEVRKGQGDMQISQDVFRERFRERFYDPEFERARADVDELADIAWRVYQESHKSPRTRAAGAGFADPSMQLSVQWLATRAAIAAAQREHDDPKSKSRVLLIARARCRRRIGCARRRAAYWRASTISQWIFSISAG
jgi:hypothetical protein